MLVLGASGVSVGATSQLSRISSGRWLKMREAVTVARCLWFRNMGNHRRSFVRAQRSVVVKVTVIFGIVGREVTIFTGIVGWEVAVIVRIFVNGSTVSISGCRHG